MCVSVIIVVEGLVAICEHDSLSLSLSLLFLTSLGIDRRI